MKMKTIIDSEDGAALGLSKPMTIGQLAQRTGVSIKALHEYDRLGLLSTCGRSPMNERLAAHDTRRGTPNDKRQSD